MKSYKVGKLICGKVVDWAKVQAHNALEAIHTAYPESMIISGSKFDGRVEYVAKEVVQ